MKRWGWLAALLLLAVVNVMVLAGVVWNRAEPEATVQLTERELPLRYRYSGSQDNTGVALRLELHDDSYSPDWLDADKLRELGFAVPEAAEEPGNGDDRYKKPLPRQAWVVLEFDGPAWQAALADEAQRLTESRLKLEAGDGTREEIKNLEEALARMRQSGSRLVAVDAGKDAAVLRARYPDTTRYLITGAQVRMWVTRTLSSDGENSPLSVRGYLRMLVHRVHVPLQHQTALQSVLGTDLRDERAGDAAQAPRYSVRLQYGRRHEPWVEEIVAPGSTGGR